MIGELFCGNIEDEGRCQATVSVHNVDAHTTTCHATMAFVATLSDVGNCKDEILCETKETFYLPPSTEGSCKRTLSLPISTMLIPDFTQRDYLHTPRAQNKSVPFGLCLSCTLQVEGVNVEQHASQVWIVQQSVSPARNVITKVLEQGVVRRRLLPASPFVSARCGDIY